MVGLWSWHIIERVVVKSKKSLEPEQTIMWAGAKKRIDVRFTCGGKFQGNNSVWQKTNEVIFEDLEKEGAKRCRYPIKKVRGLRQWRALKTVK